MRVINSYLNYIQEENKQEAVQEAFPFIIIPMLQVATSLAMVIIVNWLFVKNSTLNKSLSDDLNKIVGSGKIKLQVYVAKSKIINACCSGTNRLFTTTKLISILNRDEVLAVMAHEAAHFNKAHAWKGLLQHYGMVDAFYWLWNKLSMKLWTGAWIKVAVGKAGRATRLIITATAEPWWVTIIVTMMATLASFTVSHFTSFHREKQADLFVKKIGYGKQLASALKKLVAAVKTKTPSPWYINAVYRVFSFAMAHPPVGERIVYLIKEDKKLESAVKSGKRLEAAKIIYSGISNQTITPDIEKSLDKHIKRFKLR